MSLTGGFKGLVQGFCLVSWQKAEISVHLVLRLYNFPSDLVPKLSSFFVKQHNYPSSPPPCWPPSVIPTRGAAFISLELHILRGTGEMSTDLIALLLGVPPS